MDAIVIGAGPAGLATAACLEVEGLDYVLLDKAERVGASWRGHYDRLHLHTCREHSHLPLWPMPEHWPRYPSRDQVVTYLEEYAAHFDLRPRLGTMVRRVSRGDDGDWEVHTDDEVLRAPAVVLATGYNRVPHRPDLPGLDGFEGPVLHSSEYDNGARFAGKRVLVVGCGNSGAEICIDLHEHGASPVLVVRSPTWVIPRDMLGQPSQITSIRLSRLPLRVWDLAARATLKVVVGDLTRWGFRRPDKGPVRKIVEDGRVSMLDTGTLDLIKAGACEVVPGVVSFDTDRVHLEDGSSRTVDAVVLATGFRPRLTDLVEGIEPWLDDRGYPTHHGERTADGLYFIGFSNPPTGALREMALEAPRIARDLKARRRSAA